MIEARITDDQGLFDRLSEIAEYSSDATHVLEISDQYADMVPVRYITNREDEPTTGYEVTYSHSSKSFFFSNADAPLALYTGAYMPFASKVPLKSTQTVYELVSAGVAMRSGRFKGVFSRLSPTATLGSLETFREIKKMKCGSKYFTIDKDKSGLPLRELFSDVRVKVKPVHTLECKITSTLPRRSANGRRFTELTVEHEGKTENFALFDSYMSINRDEIIGQRVTLVLNEKNGIVKIAPPGFTADSITQYSPGPRAKRAYKIPVAAFRTFLYEYLLRGGRIKVG